MQQVRAEINGGSAEEVEAVRAVLRRAGLDGPCTANMHAQGEGIWMVLIEASPGMFLSGFLGAAGVDAWKRLKQFRTELRVARNEEEDSHGQIYVRPDPITTQEWEDGDRKGPVPGAPKPGTDEGLLVDSLMTDEELQALFESPVQQETDGGTFFEREDAEHAGYLTAELAEGLTREELIERMEALLTLTHEAAYDWQNNHGALIYATIARSARTFTGICMLLRSGLAVQAGMLTRSLFEDMVVTHWLVLKADERDWFVGRFLRQREAIALHQRKLQKETEMAMGPPISAPDDIEDRAEALSAEFGPEARKNWWDPGENGEGKGRNLGLRKIAQQLEKAAEEHKMFHPRFAGGDADVLNRTELVAMKWLNQCLHHTTIGLPFTPTSEDTSEVPKDSMVIVGFTASWLFAQQVYLLQELHRRDLKEIETLWMYCMAGFVKVMMGPEAEEQVIAEWDQLYGQGDEPDAPEEPRPQRWWHRLWKPK